MTEREAFCRLIGCSGVDRNCPGNPACGIVLKFFPAVPSTPTTTQQRPEE